MSSLELLNPERVWIGVGVSLILLLISLTSTKKVSRLGDLGELALKIVAALLLSLAVSGVYQIVRSSIGAQLALVDVSDSIDDSVGQALIDKLVDQVGDDVPLELVPFAGVVGEPVLFRGQHYNKLRKLLSEPSRQSSNIELALHHIKNSGRDSVHLVSDGYETVGSVERVLPQLQDSKVAVHPVIADVGEELQKGVSILQIDAPLLVGSAERSEVRVVVDNSTELDQTGQLLVKQAGKEVANRTISLAAGQRQVIEVESSEIIAGSQDIIAEFIPQGSKAATSERNFVINGQKKEKILLLSGAAEDGRYLKEILKRRSFELVTFEGNGTVLPDLPSLKDFSVVILNNIASKHLPLGVNALIEEFVSNGGSLLMTGGNSSFGLGGYKETPIAKALPVVVEEPRPETKRLNVAVQLVLDKSGSMKQGSKIVFARLAAQQVVKNLKDQDYFGLIAFDDFPFVVQPMGLLSAIRERAFRAPEDLMHPTGTTNLFPALDMGLKNLARAQAGRKHLIVLTDGKIPDGASHGDLYLKVVGDARSDYGVTVSTFLVGAESDGLLRDLASKGGGAFHQTENIQSLPSLFMQDITVNTGDKTQREAEHLDVRSEARMRSVSLKSFPPLKGFVQTSVKPKANLELSIFGGGSKSSPLMVSWDYGKGKALAYTSDVTSRWGERWITWGRNQQFWVEVLDSLRSVESDPNANQFEISTHAEGAELVVDLQLFKDSGDLVTAELLSPSGKTSSVQFEGLARGRFGARIDRPEQGVYIIKPKIGEKALAEVSFQNDIVSAERSGQGLNLSLLRKIAARTVGTGEQEGAAKSSQVGKAESRKDLSYLLCLAGLVAWVLSVVFRERRVVRSYFRGKSAALSRSRIRLFR